MRYTILSILLLLMCIGTAGNAVGQNRRAAMIRHQDTGDTVTSAEGRPYTRFTGSNGNGVKDATGEQSRVPRRGAASKNNAGGSKKVDRFSDRDGDGINDDRATDSRNDRLRQIEERRQKRENSSRE